MKLQSLKGRKSIVTRVNQPFVPEAMKNLCLDAIQTPDQPFIKTSLAHSSVAADNYCAVA